MTKNPILSIIIPTYHRYSLVKMCIQSILNASNPGVPIEIIVVDDGGNLNRTIETELPSDRIQWIYLPENKGQAHAQYVGYQYSSGNILAFLDDDLEIDRHWISEIIRFFEKQQAIHCVVGKIEAMDNSHILARTRQVIYDHRHLQYCDSAFTDHVKNKWNLSLKSNVFLCERISAGNFAIRKQVVESNKDTSKSAFSFANDATMSRNLLQAGYAIAYNPNMIIYHHHDTKYRTLLKIGSRKMRQHCEDERNVNLKLLFRLIKNVICSPLDIFKNQEMFRADKSRRKVYSAFTLIRMIYALGELMTFLRIYIRLKCKFTSNFL